MYWQAMAICQNHPPVKQTISLLSDGTGSSKKE
jgi:hypothetical protein